MSEIKQKKITRKIRETVKIDKNVIAEITEHLDFYYSEYNVSVELNNGDCEGFNNLKRACNYAGQNSDYLNKIIVTASKENETFYLEFVNPDSGHGATVIFKGVCKDSYDRDKMKTFFSGMETKLGAYIFYAKFLYSVVLMVIPFVHLFLLPDGGRFNYLKLMGLISITPFLLWHKILRPIISRNHLQLYIDKESSDYYTNGMKRLAIIEFVTFFVTTATAVWVAFILF